MLISQRMMSEIIKCNSQNLFFFQKAYAFTAHHILFMKITLLAAWGFLEHQYQFNVNHAPSQKNTFWLPVLETTTNTSFLVPSMEERVLVCL
jgi:hypothetical protein